MLTIQQNWIRRVEVILHVIIWVFFFGAMVFTFYNFMTIEDTIKRAVVNVGPLAILFYLSTWFVNRFWERKDYLQFALACLLSLVVLICIRAYANGSFTYEEMFYQKVNWVWGATFTSFSVQLFAVLYQMLYNRYRAEKTNLSIISEQKEAQLQALRAQINPHFLFNTLNNIYALAMVDPKLTAEMVLKLSNLLRYVIYDSQEKQVVLKKEISQLEEFIGLFQMRMEEPAKITFTHRGIMGNEMIEPMILIPFLENGFKHGDFDSNPDAFLSVDLSVENDMLDFQVLNSKNQHNLQKDPQGGVGLENIKKRLDLKYDHAYQLDIQNREKEFFVRLKLQLTHE